MIQQTLLSDDSFYKQTDEGTYKKERKINREEESVKSSSTLLSQIGMTSKRATSKQESETDYGSSSH